MAARQNGRRVLKNVPAASAGTTSHIHRKRGVSRILANSQASVAIGFREAKRLENCFKTMVSKKSFGLEQPQLR
jgi:hypothetical protein